MWTFSWRCLGNWNSSDILKIPAPLCPTTYSAFSLDCNDEIWSAQPRVPHYDNPLRAVAYRLLDDQTLTRDLWEPLPSERHIRLLNIYSFQGDTDATKQELLECSLEIARLEAVKETYEALSYAWDDEEEEEEGKGVIVCDGLEILVWKNLYQALSRLQQRTPWGHVQKIWVDTLSIAQYNVEERQRQILLMGEIFSRASQVLIWVGEQDAASRYVISISRFRAAMGP